MPCTAAASCKRRYDNVEKSSDQAERNCNQNEKYEPENGKQPATSHREVFVTAKGYGESVHVCVSKIL